MNHDDGYFKHYSRIFFRWWYADQFGFTGQVRKMIDAGVVSPGQGRGHDDELHRGLE